MKTFIAILVVLVISFLMGCLIGWLYEDQRQARLYKGKSCRRNDSGQPRNYRFRHTQWHDAIWMK